eukprot:scaffold59458_cov64-Phaeocystis_antarctica.AAC.2
MQPHRSNALDGAAAALTVTLRRGVTVMVLVSSASGPRVSSCTRTPRYFGPYPSYKSQFSFTAARAVILHPS